LSGFGVKNISMMTRQLHRKGFSSQNVSDDKNREREEIEIMDEWIADLDRNNCSVLKGE
jgi:hypothetical protein